MKIAFRYPAMIVFADAPEMRLLETECGTAYVLDNKSSYFHTKKLKLCWDIAERSNQYFWPIEENTLFPISMFWDDGSFLDAIKARSATFKDDLAAIRADIADPDAYVARMAQIRSERQQEYAAQEARREAARLAADLKEEARHQAAIVKFTDGGDVSWADFERMCATNDILLHIRTIGSGRKHVSSVSTRGCMISKGAKPDKIWEAIRQLKQILTTPAIAA